jgi:hypothetical protein
MKTPAILILIIALAIFADVELCYTLTDNQAARLSAAVVGFRPIPQVNTGTDENPVWIDSCNVNQWVRFVIKDELKKKVLRWEEMEAKRAVTVDDW